MRTRSGNVCVVLAICVVVLFPQPVAAYAGPPTYWRFVEYSDVVAVGVLSDVSVSSIDGYLCFEGDLAIESVAFGDTSPGDTLRVHWRRPEPGGPRALVIKRPSFYPEHEHYAARGSEFPGVRVLWFLTLRDGGGVAAESSRSLISLSSERALESAIENLTEQPGPTDIEANVLSVLGLLRTEYENHPARAGQSAQRSN
jgi:hypothetical protein